MIRIFSEEKKQELFALLDAIELEEWKSFRDRCRENGADCGDWAEKLDIYRYTDAADVYQKEIHELNESAKNQVTMVFENVYETDRRYAELFRGYQEEVKAQIAQVKALQQVIAIAGGDENNDGEAGGNMKKIRELIETVKQPLDITLNHNSILSFLNGETDSFDLDSAMEELDELYADGCLTSEKYEYFKSIIEKLSSGEIPYYMMGYFRAQMRPKYDEVLQENAVLDAYVNEEVLASLKWEVEGAGDFIEKLRTCMMQNGITNETSVKFFLITITHESWNGRNVLEVGGASDFEGNGYSTSTRGAGLIQLTSGTQVDYLDYLIAHEEDGDTKEELQRIRDCYTKIGDDWIYTVPSDGVTASEYIAEHYAIESAVWFWGVYTEKVEIDGETMSINECIARYDGQTDLEIMFVASQYAVNGSKYKPRGIGRLFNPKNQVELTDSEVILTYIDEEDGVEKEVRSAYPNNWEDRKADYDILYGEGSEEDEANEE